MFGVPWPVAEAVERLSRHDPTLRSLNFYGNRLTDDELGELADCLLVHPNVVTEVELSTNQLTDETGVKLARYLAASSTIESLFLSDNQLDEATYLAVAAALRVNNSLQHLALNNNQRVDETRIDAAFVEALRLNRNRPGESVLSLYLPSCDYLRLLERAEHSHPSMLELLVVLC